MTTHNSAKKNQIAKVVIMPGDPLRAEWISSTYLSDAQLVNRVRNNYAFTGNYHGKPVTLMAHGMGMPSAAIYFHELFSPEFYDVDTIIRIGSTGSCNRDLHVNDVVIVNEAYTDSNFVEQLGVKVSPERIFYPSQDLLNLAVECSKKQNASVKLGRVYSTDIFYADKPLSWYEQNKIDAVDMETVALYATAQKLNKRCLSLLTVSDSLITHEALSTLDRQQSFKKMVEFVLDNLLVTK